MLHATRQTLSGKEVRNAILKTPPSDTRYIVEWCRDAILMSALSVLSRFTYSYRLSLSIQEDEVEVILVVVL